MTRLDPADGHLFFKQTEKMINNVSPPLTYLVRSNSDVTCLLSGTVVRAVVGYVADYITNLLSEHTGCSTPFATVLTKKVEFRVEASIRRIGQGK